MSHKFTHTGILVGDMRARIKRVAVMLRETKLFWVSDTGTKYRKATGTLAGGERWPVYHLDVSTVQRVKE